MNDSSEKNLSELFYKYDYIMYLHENLEFFRDVINATSLKIKAIKTLPWR